MTLDELDMIFAAHCLTDRKADRRAGIRAVVEALRDELLPPKRKVSASSTIVRAIILQKFNEILASDGGEAAAIRAAAGEEGK